MKQILDEQLLKLIQLAVRVQLCADYDCEVTIGCNGVSAFETLPAIKEVFNILDIPLPQPSNDERRTFIEDVLSEDPADYDLE